MQNKTLSLILIAGSFAKVLSFHMMKAAGDSDTERFYAIRPECKNDVPKARFKPMVGLLICFSYVIVCSFVESINDTCKHLLHLGVSNVYFRHLSPCHILWV